MSLLKVPVWSVRAKRTDTNQIITFPVFRRENETPEHLKNELESEGLLSDGKFVDIEVLSISVSTKSCRTASSNFIASKTN